MLRIWFFVTLLVVTALNQVTQAQNFNFRTVALEGQAAPGSSGGKFSLFLLTPSINDSGDVAFKCTISGGSAGQGIFLFSNGTLSAIALEGQEAPGGAGAKFTGFGPFKINNAGDVAFYADTSVVLGGIFIFSKGQLTLVAHVFANYLDFNDTGMIALSGGGIIYLISGGVGSQISPDGNHPSLNNKGEVAFVRSEKRGGLLGGSVVDVAIILYSKGTLSPIFSPGDSFLTADLNDSGDIAFLFVVTGDNQIGLFRKGSISTLVPSAHRALSPPQINNSGFIAFAEEGQGIVNRDSLNRIALFDGNKFSRITGGEAPQTGGGQFSGFGGPSLNNRGAMAFIGYLTGGNADRGIFIAAPAQNEKLYFAQFGNGSQSGTSISSQITLVSLDLTAPANVSLEINDDSGNPLTVNLNGALVAGRTDVVIPANGALTLKTDGQGPIQAGSVTVSSDRKISGVILFAGNAGTAGVGDSKPLKQFVAPVETGLQINTGVALMGLGQDQTIQLQLRDEQGNLVASGTVNLKGKSHLAKFITELQWDTPPDFSRFSGTLNATGTALFSATVIRASPGQFTTLPVAERN